MHRRKMERNKPLNLATIDSQTDGHGRTRAICGTKNSMGVTIGLGRGVLTKAILPHNEVSFVSRSARRKGAGDSTRSSE